MNAPALILTASAVAWDACCDQFAAEQVGEGAVAWIRGNNPYKRSEL